jgi:DNA polymerase-3 subunit delta
MDRKTFHSLLSRGELPPVLLFEGDDEYSKNEAFQALRSALLPAGLEELNETLLDAPDTDSLIAAAETMPLMADRRLVVVRDHPALFGRAESDDALLAYLPNVPPTSLLLFYCTQKPDGRKKLYTAVKKGNGVVTFAPLKDRELTSFVTEQFRRAGRECDERTADYLIFISGTDTNLLSREIQKIASYHPDVPQIHPDDVRSLATPSLESSVFQMVDAVVSGQSSRAFLLMRNQLLVGAEPLYMLSMLLRQFRFLQHIRIMQYEKRSVSEIRSALGIPSFAADQYIRQAAGWSNGQVKSAVSICFDTEYAVKSGRLNQDGALEAVVLKLLNLRTSG